MKYGSPPEVRHVFCNECSKAWRYGCPECAHLFADFHRNDKGHKVHVVDPRESRIPEKIQRLCSWI